MLTWQETLVKDWRKLWARAISRSMSSQLPRYRTSAIIRCAGRQAAVLSLPHTGMAVTIDIGDPKDVHPHNKAPLGERADADRAGQCLRPQAGVLRAGVRSDEGHWQRQFG